jgi:hypothetical protein
VAYNARDRLFVKLKCLSRLGDRDVHSTERRMPIERNAVEVHDASKNTVRHNTLGNLSMSSLIDDRRLVVKGDREQQQVCIIASTIFYRKIDRSGV